jgi:hypothetical protein
MNTPTVEQRLWVLVAMFVVSVGGVLLVAPIPQDPAYHLFADSRALLGIANFGDVTSNVGFILVGVPGMWLVTGTRGRRIFTEAADGWPYGVFFFGVALVCLGSGYYHLEPGDDRLFWDRLPMTIAFMSLFSAIVADRIDRRAGIFGLLPVLLVLGMLSLVYWDWTEAQGRGDLRFYGLVQFYPMAALPVICWLFRKAGYTGGGYLIWVIVWYAIAKVLEHFDAEVFDLLGHTVSGHSLKHLASAVATFMVLRMVMTAPERR